MKWYYIFDCYFDIDSSLSKDLVLGLEMTTEDTDCAGSMGLGKPSVASNKVAWIVVGFGATWFSKSSPDLSNHDQQNSSIQ